MSEASLSYTGGSPFATARRGMDEGELAFIRTNALRGRTRQQVARMLARPYEDVASRWPEAAEISAFQTVQTLRMRLAAAEEEVDRVQAIISEFQLIDQIGPMGAQIIRDTAIQHGLTVDDLTGESLLRHIARARQDAMWRLWRVGKWSFPAIGKMLGGRDHTTIIHGKNAHQARLDAAQAAAEAA